MIIHYEACAYNRSLYATIGRADCIVLSLEQSIFQPQIA